MDRLDDGIRGRCQEAVNLMRPRDRLRLGATIAVERGPYSGEREQRPILRQREPHYVFLLGLILSPRIRDTRELRRSGPIELTRKNDKQI